MATLWKILFYYDFQSIYMSLLQFVVLICLFIFQHDAQMDYYGTRLATCSSDRTVKIFDVRNGGQILVADLRG